MSELDNVIYGTDFHRRKGHTSICATSNGPALPVGECDCGGIDPLGTMAKEIMDQLQFDAALESFTDKTPA